MKRTLAVTVIIENHGLFLWGKRSLTKAMAPGYWCPISGRVEPGETETQAVVREVWEEVGLEVKPTHKVTTMLSHNGLVELRWWRVEILSSEAYLKNNEHSEIGWFSLSELESLSPVFPEDLKLYQDFFK